MKTLFSKLSLVQWAAIILIIIGLAFMIPKGIGMVESIKEARYAIENDFAAGNLDPALIRPWMSIRYISAAYAVPQDYLFTKLGITPGKDTSLIAVERLSTERRFNMRNKQFIMIPKVQQAILDYRANPVSPGLIERQVEDWMTIQYIANSTGIKAEDLMAAVNLPAEGNLNKPIGFLADELKFSGGKNALIGALQTYLVQNGKVPAQP